MHWVTERQTYRRCLTVRSSSSDCLSTARELSALKNSDKSSRAASNTGEEKVTPEGLIELCKQRMVNDKYSRRIEIMEESPKTPTGKFLRRELCDKTRRQVDALRPPESKRIFSNHERKGES